MFDLVDMMHLVADQLAKQHSSQTLTMAHMSRMSVDHSSLLAIELDLLVTNVAGAPDYSKEAVDDSTAIDFVLVDWSVGLTTFPSMTNCKMDNVAVEQPMLPVDIGVVDEMMLVEIFVVVDKDMALDSNHQPY